MTEMEARALLTQLIEEVKAGQVPEISQLSPDAKNTLLRVAELFEEDWTIRSVAAILPDLRTEEDVSAFRMGIRFFRGMRLVYQVVKFAGTLPGALLLLAIVSLMTGLGPMEILAWYNSAKP